MNRYATLYWQIASDLVLEDDYRVIELLEDPAYADASLTVEENLAMLRGVLHELVDKGVVEVYTIDVDDPSAKRVPSDARALNEALSAGPGSSQSLATWVISTDEGRRHVVNAPQWVKDQWGWPPGFDPFADVSSSAG